MRPRSALGCSREFSDWRACPDETSDFRPDPSLRHREQVARDVLQVALGKVVEGRHLRVRGEVLRIPEVGDQPVARAAVRDVLELNPFCDAVSVDEMALEALLCRDELSAVGDGRRDR
jgi:hypothetical protein